jgi:futalosine hydrolase
MAMPVFIGTFTKYFFIFLPAPVWIKEFMSRIKMFYPGYIQHQPRKIFANVTPIGRNVKATPEICGMQLLLVAATEMEIAPLLGQNISADFLITGVGSPASIYKLVKALQQKQYDLVIQAGIAGTFSGADTLGETVLVEKDLFGDLGILENKQLNTLFDAGLARIDEFPWQNGWLPNSNEVLHHSRLRKVRAVTVNTVSDDLHLAGLYIQKYNAEIETMEGAALHYVCLRENIPFLQIRSLSNLVGERDKSKWEMKKAIQHLNEELGSLLKQILFPSQTKTARP